VGRNLFLKKYKPEEETGKRAENDEIVKSRYHQTSTLQNSKFKKKNPPMYVCTCAQHNAKCYPFEFQGYETQKEETKANSHIKQKKNQQLDLRKRKKEEESHKRITFILQGGCRSSRAHVRVYSMGYQHGPQLYA